MSDPQEPTPPTPGSPGTPNFEFPTNDVLVSEQKPSTWRSVAEWAVVLVGAVVMALIIKTFLFQAFYIPSESMVPTLEVGDRVLVNKLSYHMHDINRGDIVVFGRPPAEQGGDQIEDLIKRVIALPGESLVLKGGQVYIDGQLLQEPYLPAGTQTLPHAGECSESDPCQIPAGEIWVMGDNRGNSKDSRYFGPIEESSVVGRAFVRIWPLNRLGGL